MVLLFNFISMVCEILTWAIVFRAILSWLSPNPTNRIAIILYRITEPILSPLRRIIPRTSMFDFTPMVAIVLLRLIIYLLLRLSIYLLP